MPRRANGKMIGTAAPPATQTPLFSPQTPPHDGSELGIQTTKGTEGSERVAKIRLLDGKHEAEICLWT